jgi:transcriptional regulator GlxA family with amidase domain
MRVAMMLYAGFQLLEASGPMDVFREANRLCGQAFYEPHFVGPSPGPVICSNGAAVGTTECLRDIRSPFDILVVPGSPVPVSAREHRELVDWLSFVGPHTGKLACVSNGAFLLARAGLADDRWLTMRDRDAQRLADEHPRVHVLTGLSCFKDGNLYSSAGLGAGTHLALALVREDLGEHAVGTIARALPTAVQR